MTWPDGPPARWPAAPPPALGPPPAPGLGHLRQLCGPHGLFEHALLERPRPECGYCTDDAGRALALACRMSQDPGAEELAQLTLGFLERAHLSEGRFRLRLGPDGTWTGDAPSDDANGRAIFGLGVAAATAPWDALREQAGALFLGACAFRSPYPRATAYLALGAAAVLAGPGADGAQCQAARQVAEHAAVALPLGEGAGPLGSTGDGRWAWPEARLAYANALLPGAALAVARALERPELAERALGLLAWLVGEETWGDHFSFTPVGGRGPGDRRPAWDQQPIEAAAMAHASALAYRLSGQARWKVARQAAAGWWLGHNDTGVAVWDPATGGGYDGLGPRGANLNQGAESTIAFLATMALEAQLRDARPLAAEAAQA